MGKVHQCACSIAALSDRRADTRAVRAGGNAMQQRAALTLIEDFNIGLLP